MWVKDSAYCQTSATFENLGRDSAALLHQCAARPTLRSGSAALPAIVWFSHERVAWFAVADSFLAQLLCVLSFWPYGFDVLWAVASWKFCGCRVRGWDGEVAVWERARQPRERGSAVGGASARAHFWQLVPNLLSDARFPQDSEHSAGRCTLIPMARDELSPLECGVRDSARVFPGNRGSGAWGASGCLARVVKRCSVRKHPAEPP